MSKRLLTLIVTICLSCVLTNSWAAISAQTNWDVTTTGNSANGGGFVASPYTATPSAPSLSLTTGGTIALNTYYCVITYTDAYGETKASSESTITVSDTTNDAIVVTSPSSVANAVNYKTYMGTVSGGPYFIQNGSGTVVGTNYTRTTTPATTGDQPSMVDYSQQDAAQLTITDGATTGAVSTITSATGGFTQNMVGNILYIASGTNFTVEYYEITSVTDTNTVVVDRACATGVGSGGNIKVGGRVNHPNTISASVVAGNIIHIKNGSYLKVGANAYVLTLSISGNGQNLPIVWLGYDTSHLDYPTGTNRPLFDGNSDTTNCIVVGATTRNILSNLRCANATSDGINGNDDSIIDIVSVKSSSNGSDGIQGDNLTILNSEFSSNTSTGINIAVLGGGRGSLLYLHDNTSSGYSGGNVGTGFTFENSISESNSGHGASQGRNIGLTAGNVFYNNTGVNIDGFAISGGGSAGLIGPIYNNVFSGNGRSGFNRSTTSTGYILFFDYNNYNGNGSTAVVGVILGSNDNTNAPAFTDAVNGDFTITSSDTALLGKGFMQSATNGLTGDYQWNIGVDQDDNVTAGANDVFGIVQ